MGSYTVLSDIINIILRGFKALLLLYIEIISGGAEFAILLKQNLSYLMECCQAIFIG